MRILAPAGAFQHEAQRGPRLGQVWIETTGVPRMGFGQPQRLGIRRRVGARGLELHGAGVGHADLIGGFARMLLQQLLERGPGRGDPAALQGFQGHAAFGKRPVRREQQLQV